MSATAQVEEESPFVRYVAIGISWLIPGAGYFLLGQKARGCVIGITIHLLFIGGLLLGGLRAVNPSDQPIWGYTQMLAGWPNLAAVAAQRQRVEWEYQQNRFISNKTRDEQVEWFKTNPPTWRFYSPKTQDVGTVYCGIAGMLNLLVIFDVFLAATARSQRHHDATCLHSAGGTH